MLITENNLNDLYKLKTKELYTFVCKKCGKKIVRQYRPSRIENCKRLLCRDCGCSETKINKTPEEKMEICKKVQQAWNSKSEEEMNIIRKRQSELCKNRSPKEKQEIIKKIQQTWNNKSSKERLEIQFKANQTKIENYGKNWREIIGKKISKSKQSKPIEEKKKAVQLMYATKAKKYGKDWRKKFAKQIGNTLRNKSLEEKQELLKRTKLTNIKKYGFDNPAKNSKIKQLAAERHSISMQKRTKKEIQKSVKLRNKTCLKRYNTIIAPRLRYFYYGISFDSMPEIAVWIYCIDHNIPIIREPCYFEFIYEGNEYKYIPDFKINGELVEIKGDQYIDKETGKWIDIYNSNNNDKYEAKHQCAIQNNVKIIYNKVYQKYLNYVYDNYGRHYLEQFRFNNPYNPSYWVYYINNTYIPNYYNNSNYIKGYGISPYDIDKDSEYTLVNSKGISPFDIKPV